MTRRTILLVLAAFIVTACGSAASAPGASPEDPVSAPAQPDSPGGSGPELREPEEGLVDVRARPFDRHRARGEKVTLFYYSGPDECYGLDRIKVVERRRRVILTIFEGRHPEAEVCPEIALEVRSVAKLRRPLGSRAVLDGAE